MYKLLNDHILYSNISIYSIMTITLLLFINIY